MISVLFLTDVLCDFGGAEKNIFQLATGLNSKKYFVVVCCLKAGRAYEALKQKGINTINLNIKRIYSPSAFLKAGKLIKFIRKEGIKIAVTYFESSDFWGSIVARLAGVPILISSRRDMGFNLKLRHKLVYRLINPIFDKIITVSDALKQLFIENEKISPEKLVTIHNGIEPFEVIQNEAKKLSLKQSLGIGSDKQVVSMVANLAPIKGHKDLLSAASEIIKNNKAVHFLLIGASKNGYERNLKDYADNLGINENITFTGFRSDIQDLLSISDISVLSSTSEGFSNSILEYMSAGKPVVVTDVGGNRELVVNGQTGLLIPPKEPFALAEAISKLLYNKELRKEMGTKGQNRVKKYFTTEKMVKRIEELFESLILTKRPIKNEYPKRNCKVP